MITGRPSWMTVGPASLPITLKKGIRPMESATAYSSSLGVQHLSNRSGIRGPVAVVGAAEDACAPRLLRPPGGRSEAPPARGHRRPPGSFGPPEQHRGMGADLEHVPSGKGVLASVVDA